MNYKLKKEYIGKPTGVSDVSILFEEEPNYGKSATIKYEITKHDKIIYNEPAVELLKKFDELANKCLQLKKKLDIAVNAMEWYDGLENLLIGWEMFTGQPKGTAKKAIKKIKEVK